MGVCTLPTTGPHGGCRKENPPRRVFDSSGLGGGSAEIHGHGTSTLGIGLTFGDFSVHRFVLFEVVLKGAQQSFGVLGSQYHTGFHTGFGHSGHHPHKVDDKFGVGMCDDRQIGINAVGDFLAQFNVEVIGLVGRIFIVGLIGYDFLCFRMEKDSGRSLSKW